MVSAGRHVQLERDAWEVLDELDACYRRDRREIEITHEVMSEAGMVPDVPE